MAEGACAYIRMVRRLLDPVTACEANVAVGLRDQDGYVVRVYDTQRQRRLAAAVEIISPANKDCPERRRASVVCPACLGRSLSVRAAHRRLLYERRGTSMGGTPRTPLEKGRRACGQACGGGPVRGLRRHEDESPATLSERAGPGIW